MHKFHYSLLSALSLAAAACVWTGCDDNSLKVSKNKTDHVFNVQVVKPQMQRFVWKIRVQGTVKATTKIEISSRMSGTLDILNVGGGSVVKKGDLLFQVDKINLENNVEIQRQQLKVAEAALRTSTIDLELTQTVYEKIEKDYKRAEQLKQVNAISMDAFERAVLNLDEAKANVARSEAILGHSKAQVEQAKNNLSISIKQLDDSRIKAPFDGIVIGTDIDPDEYVREGENIVHLEKQNSKEIAVFISSSYYNYIIPEQTKAEVYTIDGKKLCDTVVSFRGPYIDALSRTFEVKMLLPPDTPAVSGMLCDIDLILQETSGWGIPTRAVLHRKDNKDVVFVVENNIAIEQAVKVGIVEGDRTQILDGDDFKDKSIIFEGQSFINNNARVNIVR